MFRAAAAACLIVCAFVVAGCNTTSTGTSTATTSTATGGFGNFLTSVSNWAINADAQVTKYAPVVGKTLIALGDIIYQAECSPAMPVAGAVAANVLEIIAPNSTAADKFNTRIQQNDDIAAQICPLVDQIKIDVGSVPAGTPAEVIAPTAN
jgi:hypothetical protein